MKDGLFLASPAIVGTIRIGPIIRVNLPRFVAIAINGRNLGLWIVIDATAISLSLCLLDTCTGFTVHGALISPMCQLVGSGYGISPSGTYEAQALLHSICMQEIQASMLNQNRLTDTSPFKGRFLHLFLLIIFPLVIRQWNFSEFFHFPIPFLGRRESIISYFYEVARVEDSR